MKLKDIMGPRAPVLDAGSYMAVCVGVIGIGMQYIPPYGDKKTGRYEDRIMFVWDVPSEVDENGVPKQLSKPVNATYSQKGNLMAILSGWNSRTYTKEELMDFDFDDQLGKPCMLTVSVSESGYSNVTAVSAVPKGVQVPASNTPFINFYVKKWSDEGFAALPDWVQNKIKESSEWKKLHTPETTVDFPDAGDTPAAGKEANPI